PRTVLPAGLHAGLTVAVSVLREPGAQLHAGDRRRRRGEPGQLRTERQGPGDHQRGRSLAPGASLGGSAARWEDTVSPANLRRSVTWRDFPLAVGAAAGTLNLRIGTVGQGKPVVTVTAGVHGDEGPWSARAIHLLLERAPMTDLIGTLRVVPVSNPLAMEADARCAPLDVLDLNRVFPGNPNGSH